MSAPSAPARPFRVAVLQGSVRQGRRSEAIAGWALARLAADPRFEADLIDPRALGLSLWHDAMAPEALSALRARIAAADAFLPVFPEYNRGYPAALKELIDLAGGEWREKPAAFVSYGGRAGGARAAEQLSQVMGELHVATLRDGVLLADIGRLFDAEERFAPDAPAEAALSLVLDRLAWWAAPLRAARESAAALPGKDAA